MAGCPNGTGASVIDTPPDANRRNVRRTFALPAYDTSGKHWYFTPATGRYSICPVIKEPRRGGIRPDATLATVRRSDGTPLPAEQGFVTDFEAVRTTGDYPR